LRVVRKRRERGVALHSASLVDLLEAAGGVIHGALSHVIILLELGFALEQSGVMVDVAPTLAKSVCVEVVVSVLCADGWSKVVVCNSVSDEEARSQIMLMLMPGANWDCPGMTVASLGMRIHTRLSIGSGGLINPAHA
jgi:hypothetical protein